MLPGFLKLAGLDENKKYKMEGKLYFGDELMNMGLSVLEFQKNGFALARDFDSFVTVIEAV